MGCMSSKVDFHKKVEENTEESVKTLNICLLFPQSDKQAQLIAKALRHLNAYTQVHWIQGDLTNQCLPETRIISKQLSEQLPSQELIDLVIVDNRHDKFSHHSNDVILTNSQKLNRLCEAIHTTFQMRDSIIVTLTNRIRSVNTKQEMTKWIFKAGVNKIFYETNNFNYYLMEFNTFLHNELELLHNIRFLKLQTNLKIENLSGAEIGLKPNYKEQISDEVLKSSKIITNLKSDVTMENSANQTQNRITPTLIIDTVSSLQEPDNKPKSFTSAQDRVNLTPDVNKTCNLQGVIHSKNSELITPMCRAVSILHSIMNRCSPVVAKDIQKVLHIIYKSDTFIQKLMKSVNSNQDPITVDLIEGLMTTTNLPFELDQVSKETSLTKPLKARDFRRLSTLSQGLEMTEEIKSCLCNDEQWEFDIFELERLTNRRPLSYLAMNILGHFNVINELKISEQTLFNWLLVIEDHYHQENPYHNATHAADVLQSAAYFLQQEPISSIFSSMDEVATLLAAIVHDLDHPGRTNAFLVNNGDQLAILYNDTTVLESHHVALAFELTRKIPEINIFQNLTRDEYRTIRSYMIDMILATEMAKHFDHVNRFVNNLSKPFLSKNHNYDRSSVGSMSSMESGSIGTSACTSVSMFGSPAQAQHYSPMKFEDLRNAEDRILIKRLIIKCSDVNNPTRPLHICKEWAQRIAEEYFSQTEEEKRSNLPIVMPNFDRQTCDISKTQVSFIDFFLKGMFAAFDSVFPIPVLMKNLELNTAYWTQQVGSKIKTKTQNIDTINNDITINNHS